MSKIQWTEQTWNPVVGCSRISPGCTSCYAERMAKRLIAMGQEKYDGTVDKNGRWTGVLNFDTDNWDAPIKRKSPTTYFVNSMSDLFHAEMPPNWLMRVWSVMAATPQHTYQILTKRADILQQRGKWLADIYGVLPNVWLGVSVENQDYTDRIDYLLRTPAAVRFLSLEPLLGPIDLSEIQPFKMRKHTGFKATGGILSGFVDWAIVGGESGPGARPCDVAWIADIVRQCKAASVPVFVKQLGARPYSLGDDGLWWNSGIGRYYLKDDDPRNFFKLKDRKGGDMNEWPKELRVREFPQVHKGA